MAEQTLEEMFVAHRPRLVWTVYRIVRCAETAEDLVQDAYVRVSAALRDRPVHTLQPFLYRTARNLALDHVRGTRIRNRIVGEAVGDLVTDDVPAAVPTPERQVIDRERLSVLETAMAALPPRRRDILICARLHGWPHARIAKHFGISKSAVQKNISVALAHCLESLDEKDDEEVRVPQPRSSKGGEGLRTERKAGKRDD